MCEREKNLKFFNCTFFFHFFDFCDADRKEVRSKFLLFFKSASLSVGKSVKSRLIFNMRIFCCSILSNIIAVMCNNEALALEQTPFHPKQNTKKDLT